MSTPDPFDSGLYNSMNSPIMGLAMGLLSAGGPSRMPVSLGQALASGMQSGQQYAAQSRANAFNQLQLMMALQHLRQMQAAGMGSQQTVVASSTGGDAGK